MLQAVTLIPYLPVGWIQNLHTHLVANRIKVEVRNIWGPTLQREEDKIIMDVVCHRIPNWAWSGINRCRLFLEATTLADITTLDGICIPDNVRSVKGRLRQSKLVFPIQVKPSKADIEQWQYLVDSISSSGRLHVPLGPWIRSSDQLFPYIRNHTNDIVYKKTPRG